MLLNATNMLKLLDVHLHRKYANIQATFEVAPINNVAKNCTQTMMMTMAM